MNNLNYKFKILIKSFDFSTFLIKIWFKKRFPQNSFFKICIRSPLRPRPLPAPRVPPVQALCLALSTIFQKQKLQNGANICCKTLQITHKSSRNHTIDAKILFLNFENHKNRLCRNSDFWFSKLHAHTIHAFTLQ